MTTNLNDLRRLNILIEDITCFKSKVIRDFAINFTTEQAATYFVNELKDSKLLSKNAEVERATIGGLYMVAVRF